MDVTKKVTQSSADNSFILCCTATTHAVHQAFQYQRDGGGSKRLFGQRFSRFMQMVHPPRKALPIALRRKGRETKQMSLLSVSRHFLSLVRFRVSTLGKSACF